MSRYLDFMAGFIGHAIPDLQLKRYTVLWSTKGIKVQDGYNWAKHAARMLQEAIMRGGYHERRAEPV